MEGIVVDVIGLWMVVIEDVSDGGVPPALTTLYFLIDVDVAVAGEGNSDTIVVMPCVTCTWTVCVPAD